MLVPANLLPVLSTESSGRNSSNTIVSGVIELWRQGLWALALIVFTASVVIPVLKVLGLSWLLLNAHRGAPRNPRRLTKIYAALDFIGRWSMLDVFVVAILVSLVKLQGLATVIPGSGLLAFGGVVCFTLLASASFDPQMMWEEEGEQPS